MNTMVVVGDQSPSNGLFMRLFGYISGRNTANKNIPMTAPVLTAYSMDSNPVGSNSKALITMAFYVPRINQDETPKPSSEDVILNNMPEMTVAVARFGGFAKFSDYARNRDRLIKALGNESISFDTINFSTAGYDAPFKPFSRRNEVWLIKK
jgi:hypothetical protein